jgi:hypothetical protein
MRLVPVAIALLAGCGSKSSPEGPAFTPGVAYALADIAPDCTLTRTPGKEQRECQGPSGALTITIVDGKLQALDIRLRSMTLLSAKVKLANALRMLITEPGTEALGAELEKLVVGDRATLRAGGATIELAAGGTKSMLPEYGVTLRWGDGV